MAKVILLADDEPDTVMIVRERLKKAGYDVISAFTGMKSFKRSKNERLI